MSKNLLILLEDNINAATLIDQSKTLLSTPFLKNSTGAYIEGISHNGIEKLFKDNNIEFGQYSYTEIIENIMRDNPLNNDEIITSIIQKCSDLNLKIDVLFNNDKLNINTFEIKSMYYDLFILGKEWISKNFHTKTGKYNIEKLLSHSKCPLLILPSKKYELKNIILLFDGTKTSFEAIKLFTYLISDQTKNATLQLIVKSTFEANKDEKFLINYIKTYRLNFSITRIDPAFYEDELFSILDQFENFLLVAGSNRKDIINDLMKNEKSYFMKDNRSIFMI